LIEPAKTPSPAPLVLGKDSPVTGDSSMPDVPERTGIRALGELVPKTALVEENGIARDVPAASLTIGRAGEDDAVGRDAIARSHQHCLADRERGGRHVSGDSCSCSRSARCWRAWRPTEPAPASGRSANSSRKQRHRRLIDAGRAGEDDAVGRDAIARSHQHCLADREPDGVILSGTSGIDESPVTGESFPSTKGAGDGVFAPRHRRLIDAGRAGEDDAVGRDAIARSHQHCLADRTKGAGDGVFAGSINREAALRVRVAKAAEDNTIALPPRG
jgi:hypothetical protein